eukprot:gene10099-13575_t
MASDPTFAQSLNRLKESFLWAAAQGGNTQDCESLLEIGADINWKNADGDTPLLAACRRGHKETVSLLLAHGADGNAVGSDSLAPIHICAKRGDADGLVVLLSDPKISTIIKTKDNQTALDIARSKGNEKIYSLLMRPNNMLNSSSVEIIPTGSNKNNIISNNRTNVNLSNNRDDIKDNRTKERKIKENDSQQSYSIMQGTKASMNSSDSGKYNSRRNESKTDNDNETSNDDHDSPTIIALRNILDEEMNKRKTLEQKLEVFKVQNSQLLVELTSLSMQVNELQECNQSLDNQINKLSGQTDVVETLNLEECEELERILKFSIENVEKRKAIIIRDKIDSQKEQRLCVICQEKEKSVVLLPCRHLCLCDNCSQHSQLSHCPLCREKIAHKIGVFS